MMAWHVRKRPRQRQCQINKSSCRCRAVVSLEKFFYSHPKFYLCMKQNRKTTYLKISGDLFYIRSFVSRSSIPSSLKSQYLVHITHLLTDTYIHSYPDTKSLLLCKPQNKNIQRDFPSVVQQV